MREMLKDGTVEIGPKVERVAILVLGRGVHIEVDPSLKRRDKEAQKQLIEAVKSGERTDLLKPTGILEAAVPGKNYRQDIVGNPEQHPTFGWQVRRGVNEPKFSRYAGGLLNVMAAARIADKAIEDGPSLEKIYWAAGRTPDLEEYAPPGWSQGTVLAKSFLGVASDDVLKSGIKMSFEPENKNTWDDLAASLIDANKEGYDEVVVVTVGVHMARTYAMTQEVLEGMKEHPDVVFRASEATLIGDGDWWPKVRKAVNTRGHDGTLAREKNGLRAMKSGNYGAKVTRDTIGEFEKPVVNMTIEEARDFS